MLKLKPNLYLIILFCCIIFSDLWGQNLKGVVLDSKGNPIENVYILPSDLNDHVHTNAFGEFNLKNAAFGDTILISHVGFNPKYFVISDFDKTVKIELEEKTFSLNEITVLPKLDALNLIADVNIKTNPVNSSQEILRKVPGLIIGQHAGGGKAEQIFLRGFDIDHGTDINITVDGIPVNMVSHAHGQGYADLHFLIPETVDNLNFGKGPYYVDKGNFTTSGFVDFRTSERIKENQFKIELGEFNTQRIMGMFSLINDKKNSAYFASEYLLTDGPFESSQNLSRINLMGKYTGYFSDLDKLNFTISYLNSKWDASGQIPQREVDRGNITRFGSIDDTEGGKTSRANIAISHLRNIGDNSYIKNNAYFSYYDFELYSNFTFFLNNPEFGDQIRQKEERQIYGFTSEFNQRFNFAYINSSFKAGAGFRADVISDNELSNSLHRIKTLDTLALGDITESNLFAYLEGSFEFGMWTINPSLRVDNYKFSYYDKTKELYTHNSENAAIISPKLNFTYNYSDDLQLYLKTGKGFHSNDTRVILANKTDKILPAAYGADLGFVSKPYNSILFNTALWYLFLEEELVYVGDEGVVEPSGKTRRLGLDLSVRYQPINWLYLNTDLNYAFARAFEEPEGADYIPLAPDLTFAASINIVQSQGFEGSLSMRYIGDRPANEDNSIVAKGYTIFDLNAAYRIKNIEFGFSIQNITDQDWNETQFATETRLQNETESVEEIHFIPGTPFALKGIFIYNF